MIRPIKCGRFGLKEDPTGAIITAGGRLYEVTGTYYRESPAAIMVTTRHFNREPGPDFAASYVRLVLPD